MKNFTKLFGIITLAAVIGFFTAACGDGGDGGDSGGGGSSFLGDTLELSGQVYLQEYTETSITYQSFDNDLTIPNLYGGSGKIKNGKLSYTIGIPTNLEILDVNKDFGYGDDNDVTISNQNVRGLFFEGFDLNDSTYYYLHKSNVIGSSNSKGYSRTGEYVNYVYVDRDVTISGKGKTRTDDYTADGVNYSSSYTTKNFSLALKAGWNAVYMKQTDSATITETSYKSTFTMTVSLGNPSLKWILHDEH